MGYSPSRLLMMGGVLFSVLLFGGLWLATRRTQNPLVRVVRFWEQHWILWGMIVVALVVCMGLLFFLLQWRFIASDEFLSAYLTRLTPVVGFLLLVFAQAIGLVLSALALPQEKKTLLYFIFGILMLLPWLLIGEYYLSNARFPTYYVAEKYSATLNQIYPLAIFAFAVYTQSLFRELPFRKNKRVRTAITLLILGLSGWIYYQAASSHAVLMNADFLRSDQSVYMEIAQDVYESGFTYLGTRNQTPLIPFIQAAFYRPEMSNAEFFAVGKQVNIALSLIFLGILFVLLGRYLSWHRSLTLWLIVAFALFIFKAGYFTAELTYYFLSFLSFLGMAEMLLKPSKKIGLVTGIVTALAYYTKASILPAVGLFVALFVVKELANWYVSRRNMPEFLWKRTIAVAQVWQSLLLLLGSLTIVLAPYLIENKAIFGHFLYNQNSTFFIWYDDFYVAKADSELYGFGKQWPDLLPDELPSLQKYIYEHTFAEIVERFRYGILVQRNHIINSYTPVNFPLLFFAAAGFATLLNWESFKNLFRRYFFMFPFFIFFLLGYLILFSWYAPIAGGPRFLYGLFLPFVFSLYWLIEKLNFAENRWQFFGVYLTSDGAIRVFDMILFALMMAQIYTIVVLKLPFGYFGS